MGTRHSPEYPDAVRGDAFQSRSRADRSGVAWRVARDRAVSISSSTIVLRHRICSARWHLARRPLFIRPPSISTDRAAYWAAQLSVREAFIADCRFFARHTGPAMSAFNAWLLSKSLETLAVRMDRHCANALAVARHFEGHARLEAVRYPFLASHPQHALARRQMSQGGGIVVLDRQGRPRRPAAGFSTQCR